MDTINKDFLKKYFINSSNVINSLTEEIDKIFLMSEGIMNANNKNAKILIAGNGGSCADAEHFAGELLCTFKDRGRKAFSAISLSNNPSAITAWSNDFEFETFFKRQVQALGNKGDILFLITTGGGNRENGASMNLVYAAEKARELGMSIFTIAGKGGGILEDFSDLCITVKSNETSNIQEAHITILHAICFCLEKDNQVK